jgi:hypothetical protein
VDASFGVKIPDQGLFAAIALNQVLFNGVGQSMGLWKVVTAFWGQRIPMWRRPDIGERSSKARSALKLDHPAEPSMSVFGAAMEAGALFQHIGSLPGARPAASELATTQISE